MHNSNYEINNRHLPSSSPTSGGLTTVGTVVVTSVKIVGVDTVIVMASPTGMVVVVVGVGVTKSFRSIENSLLHRAPKQLQKKVPVSTVTGDGGSMICDRRTRQDGGGKLVDVDPTQLLVYDHGDEEEPRSMTALHTSSSLQRVTLVKQLSSTSHCIDLLSALRVQLGVAEQPVMQSCSSYIMAAGVGVTISLVVNGIAVDIMAMADEGSGLLEVLPDPASATGGKNPAKKLRLHKCPRHLHVNSPVSTEESMPLASIQVSVNSHVL